MEHLECLIYGLVYYFPLSFFAFYPLRYFSRFGIKKTFLLNLCYGVPNILTYYLIMFYFQDYYYISIVLLLVINISAYALLYTINPWRILFNFLLIVNVANFIVMFSDFLVFLLFPKTAEFSFHWTNSLCTLITEIFFLIPSFCYIKHYSDSMIRNSDYDYIWRLAWLIPMLLSCMGYFFVYSDSISADSLIGIMAKKSIMCGIILVCLLLMYSFIAKLIGTQHNILMLEKDLYHQSIQKIQLQKIEAQIQDTRVLRHDLRHHIRLMCNYVEQKDYDSLKDYLYQYNESIQQISQLHYTSNTLVNTLLVYYADLCRSKHIEFDAKITLPNTLPIQDNEITILSSNLLENPYHACEEMNENLTRYIHVRATCKSDSNFIIMVDNTYNNKTIQDGCGNFLTTKTDGNGLGLLSVKELVSKYDGYMKIDTDHGIFSVSISIPIILPEKIATSRTSVFHKN